MKDAIIIALATILATLAIGLLFLLDFVAYKERFPNAPGWTYIFK